MKNSTIEDLLVHETQVLYNAEQQITRTLARMAEAAAAAPDLQAALREHGERSRRQAGQLQQALRALGPVEALRSSCEGVLGILNEAGKVLGAGLEPEAVGLELALAARRLTQYQAAGYRAARGYAAALGRGQEARLLEQALGDEQATLEKLSELAHGLLSKKPILEDLLVHETQVLYNAEQQITRTLARMAEAAAAPDLQAALREHGERSRRQAGQLQQALRALGPVEALRSSCEGVLGILNEAGKVLGAGLEPEAVDLELALAARRLTQYQAAGYRAARGYAAALGRGQEARLLEQALGDEQATLDWHAKFTQEVLSKKTFLEDLLVHETQVLYNAEQQITRTLARMAEAAAAPDLQAALREHGERSRRQAGQLQQALRALGPVEALRSSCEGVLGILNEAGKVLGAGLEPEAVDLELALAARRLTQYQAAGYRAARGYAAALGRGQEAQLLEQALGDEQATLEKLSELAHGLLGSR